MTISRFIKNDFLTVDAYEGVARIRHSISDHSAAIVMDQNRPVGMLTTNDLVKKQHTLVIDCMIPKPGISPRQSIREVLTIMKETHAEALPAYDDNNDLIGVIYKNDILDYLCHVVEKQQSMVQLMVHDLKSPLANIISIHDLLLHETDKEEGQKLLNYSRQSCEIATGIINDMLVTEMVESEDISATIIELGSFIKGCMMAVSGLISKKSIHAETQLPAGMYYFRADKQKLERAVHNILYNAIKFTPPEGIIKVSCITRQDSFTIEIEDSGIGIPEKDQPFIFQKFTKAKRKGTNGESSTGLGMYITNQIIQQHKGEIWFTSKEGQGTSFFIRLQQHSDTGNNKLHLVNEPH